MDRHISEEEQVKGGWIHHLEAIEDAVQYVVRGGVEERGCSTPMPRTDESDTTCHTGPSADEATTVHKVCSS